MRLYCLLINSFDLKYAIRMTNQLIRQDSLETIRCVKTSKEVEPAAWRYWKDKFGCWEYSDVLLKFPAVPAGTKMEPLYLHRDRT